MYQYIAPGSIIISDSAPMYQGCTALGFSDHWTVTHSKRESGRFVDPTNPLAHMQNIEVRNRQVRSTIKSLRTDRALQQYICEYLYRNRVLSGSKTPGEKFRQFIRDVIAAYPGPGQQGLQLGCIGVDTADFQHHPGFDLPADKDIPLADIDVVPASVGAVQRRCMNTFGISSRDDAEADPSSICRLCLGMSKKRATLIKGHCYWDCHYFPVPKLGSRQIVCSWEYIQSGNSECACYSLL